MFLKVFFGNTRNKVGEKVSDKKERYTKNDPFKWVLSRKNSDSDLLWFEMSLRNNTKLVLQAEIPSKKIKVVLFSKLKGTEIWAPLDITLTEFIFRDQSGFRRVQINDTRQFRHLLEMLDSDAETTVLTNLDYEIFIKKQNCDALKKVSKISNFNLM